MSLRDDGYRPAMARGKAERMLLAQGLGLVEGEIELALATLDGGGSLVTAVEALMRAQDYIAGGTTETYAAVVKMEDDGREIEEDEEVIVDAAGVPVPDPGPLPPVEGIFKKPTKRRRKKKRRTPLTEGVGVDFKVKKGRRLSQIHWTGVMVSQEKAKRMKVAPPVWTEGIFA